MSKAEPVTYRQPTPVEQLQWNPHQLEEGDEVILPDGRTGKLYQCGWRWGRLVGGTPGTPGEPVELKYLRRKPDPASMPDQLELF